MPYFSVIIPLYNKEKFILKAVDSVLTQFIDDLELIIVDDASTDRSLALVENIKDDRISVIKRKAPGSGGYSARNTGAKSAKAEWLTFLDADDLWMQDHLVRIRDVAESHPDANFIHTGFQKIGKKHVNVVFPKLTILEPEAAMRELSKRDIFHINSTAVRKPIYDLSGGFIDSEGWNRGGDSELWPRLLAASNGVIMVPHVSSIWDMRNSGVTIQKFHTSQQHPALTSFSENKPEGQSRNFKKSQLSFAVRKQLMWDVKAPVGSKPLQQSLSLFMKAPLTRQTTKELFRLIRKKLKNLF